MNLGRPNPDFANIPLYESSGDSYYIFSYGSPLPFNIQTGSDRNFDTKAVSLPGSPGVHKTNPDRLRCLGAKPLSKENLHEATHGNNRVTHFPFSVGLLRQPRVGALTG